jgi:hypothetical protein
MKGRYAWVRLNGCAKEGAPYVFLCVTTFC